MNARGLRFPAALAALLLLCGCLSEEVMIRRVPARERIEYGARGANGELSPQTRNLLANRLLAERFEKAPEEVLLQLERAYLTENQPTFLLALADLSFYLGRHADNPDRAAQAYLSTLLYTYEFLVGVDRPQESAYSAERMEMLRLYNQALTEFFDHLKQRNLLFRNAYQLTSLTGRRVSFQAPDTNIGVSFSLFSDYLLCADFRPQNLTHVSYRLGLGVPLIFKLSDDAARQDHTIYPGQTLPVTLVMKLDYDGDENHYQAQLLFKNVLNTEEITLGSRKLVFPLELDFSTPIAYMTRRQPLFNFFFFMRKPGETKDMQGLYQLQPFDPNRIPVLFVHGLLSNPRTWVQMINTLQNDPEIRRNYQFWGFSYSSGNPILYSAELLRQATDEILRRYDPEGRNEKLKRMVVVGHSMGGLLSKTMIMNSDSRIVDKMLQAPLDQLLGEVSPQQRELLRSMLVWSARDYARRVVFIAVPHRGSNIATEWVGRVGSNMIELPTQLVSGAEGFLHAWRLRRGGSPEEFRYARVATGIENLAPDSEVLAALMAIPFVPGIPYHSIIGNRERGDTPGGSDGVVPYASSHLDNAASEVVVQSGHSVQQNPLAILELRRILLEHLRQYPDTRRPEKKDPRVL